MDDGTTTHSVDLSTLETDYDLSSLNMNGATLEANLNNGNKVDVNLGSLFDAKYNSAQLVGDQLQLTRGLTNDFINLSPLKVSNAQLVGTNLNLTIGGSTLSADLLPLQNTLVNVKPTNATLTGTNLLITLSDGTTLTADLQDLEDKTVTSLSLSNSNKRPCFIKYDKKNKFKWF